MRSGEITLPFGGEDRLFKLPIGHVRAVEEKTGFGLGMIAMRIRPLYEAISQGFELNKIIGLGLAGSWKVDEVYYVLFEGLVGGGMLSVEAKALVERFVNLEPTLSAVVAYQVCAAWLAGGKEEAIDLGEPKAAKRRPPSKTASRDGKESTAPGL